MSAKGYASSFGLAAFGDRRGVAAVDAGRGGEALGGALEATTLASAGGWDCALSVPSVAMEGRRPRPPRLLLCSVVGVSWAV